MIIATGFNRRTSIVVPAARSPSPEKAAMTSGTASTTDSQFARPRSRPSTSVAPSRYAAERRAATPNSYIGGAPSTIHGGAGVAISASSVPII
jgi:hypothetical protein